MESELSIAQQRYVERIAEAVERHGHAHVSALAEEMGVSKPSVVQMVGRLTEAGIVIRNGAEMALSDDGRRLAGELEGRHALLREFMLGELGMDRSTAETEACRLEHVVSPEFLVRLRAYRSAMTA